MELVQLSSLSVSIFFATSTILGWGYYGEKCFQYLFPTKRGAVIGYRIAFVLFIMVGAVVSLDLVWMLADVLNGLMAIPNLIGLLGLSGVIVMETKRFQEKINEEKEAAKLGKTAPVDSSAINVMIMSEANEGWTTLWIYLSQHLKM